MKSLAAIMSAGLVSVLTCGAAAQVITVTGQERYIEGVTSSITDGIETVTGPFRNDAPKGDFGAWGTEVVVPGGNMTVSGTQASSFNGSDTLQVGTFAMNFSGGGGPGTSGSGTLTNTCSFTLTVNQPSTFTLDGLIASGPFVNLTLQLSGPGIGLSFDASNSSITLDGTAGSLNAGEHTLTLIGTGTVSYVGPGGNGSGAGGSSPFVTLVVTPAGNPCPADFNNDTVVNSQDFFDFLAAFFAGLPTADFNNDTQINSQDFFDFLTAFFTGC